MLPSQPLLSECRSTASPKRAPVFQKAIFDEENKIIGYEDSLIQERADSVIISISQMPRKKLVRTTAGLEADDRGRLVVDEQYKTTRPGVFAAGDVVSGAKTVVHARRSNEKCLSTTWTRNCLLFENIEIFCVDCEPILWYNVLIIVWLASTTDGDQKGLHNAGSQMRP